MSRREAALSAALVFVVALLVRGYAASLVGFPKPEDTAYYVDAARNLLGGRGLVSDALWSFQTQPLIVPPVSRCVVPRLKGKTLTKARSSLKRAHCRLGSVSKPRPTRT